MESQYYEHLVNCKPQVLMKVVSVVSIIGFILSLLLIPASFLFGIIGCIVMGVICWYSRRESGKDYEYVYVDGDISFDAIYNKAKRKTKGKASWEDIKLICRGNAPELEGYRQKNARVQNFTSGDKNSSDVYALVMEKEGNSTIIYFEPAKEMLEMMWRKGPSKVQR